jgi:transcriptional antiterminator RfaH
MSGHGLTIDATRDRTPATTASLGRAGAAAWYVVSTKPRREDFAATQIAQRGIDVFLPRLVLVRRGGERVVRPLFPGYLFARLVLAAEGARVTWAPGVRRLVSFEGDPPPVPEAAIDFLRSQATPEGVIVARPRPLPVGRRVRVTTGPLAGLVGIIENPPDARGRVGVLMELLRRPMRVSVDVDALEEA